MKKIYFHIFLLSLLFFENGNNNSFTSDILSFEKEKKAVTLFTSKTHFFTPRSKKYKFKKDRYFEIVPPVYQFIEDTLITYDTTINYDDMNYMYQLVQEMVLVEQGGWKWEAGKTNSKKSKILKLTKDNDKFISVNKVVLGPTRRFNLNTKRDQELHLKKAEKALANIRAGRIKEVITRRVCIKDGYLNEIRKEEVSQQQIFNRRIIKFRKGSWTLLKLYTPNGN